MIDTATGMKPGERYSVENIEREHAFSGFFLDGKYYLGPELLTAVGWLEGQKFIYDDLDPAGEPVFPDRIAGTITDLQLTLVDGVTFVLVEMDAEGFVEAAPANDDEGVMPSDSADDEVLPEEAPVTDDTQRLAHPVKSRDKAKRVLALTAVAILSTCVVVFLRRDR